MSSAEGDKLQLNRPDPLGVLETTLPVVTTAKHVRIVSSAIAKYALSANSAAAPAPVEETLHCTWLPPHRFCNYLLALECLNFCFWDEEPRWRVAYGEGRHNGYWALAAALHRALREDAIPVWEARWLAEADEVRVGKLLRGEGRTIPLLKERVQHLREAGEALMARWGGEFANVIKAAGGDAVALVKLVVAEFPSFRDEAVYRGQTVQFWKRAQICVADLARLLPGDGPRAHPLGQLARREELTAFADYKVPQVLRALGILEYAEDLAHRVDGKIAIPMGSEEEIEIRAATVWACELIARELGLAKANSRRTSAADVDMQLWIAGQQLDNLQPYHRTRTPYY